MKKILCLIDTLGIGGGAERQMLGLATFLKERGYYVDLVSYHNDDGYVDSTRQYGPNIVILKTKNSKWAKLWSVRKFIISRGDYDWVIAYKDGPTIISCLLKLFGAKFKLIVSERNTNQNVSIKDKLKFLLYRVADFIVPNSYSQKNFIKQNFPNLQDKVVTITNFTDTSHFVPIESGFNDKLNVLTVGRITAQKNILKYLDALNLLICEGYADKVHFDWYGDAQVGDDEYRIACLNKVKELGLQDFIRFQPATKDIVSQYQKCDIFCLPSVYEGFPNVICEAMSCGKPIMCSRVCDNPHIVKENINGLLFDPKDVNSIYLALKKMIGITPSKRIEWGETSRSIAESLFSKEVFVQKYIELIECK